MHQPGVQAIWGYDMNRFGLKLTESDKIIIEREKRWTLFMDRIKKEKQYRELVDKVLEIISKEK